MSGLLIDCFAGGGGASKGIELALNRPIDIAVNHDPEAFLTNWSPIEATVTIKKRL